MKTKRTTAVCGLLESMVRITLRGALGGLGIVAMAAHAGAPPAASADEPQLTIAADATGLIGTFKADGPVDPANPFFQSLGTNGRSCSTCHVATEAMSFTPVHARELYDRTRGSDPLFANVDGANCDNVTASDRSGHSLVLRHGLIRVAMPVPPSAEFSIAVVNDPYGCALRIDPKTNVLTASVYRRPLPTANLSFLSAVMFDGRETKQPLTSATTFAANRVTDLSSQAVDATTTHAQAAAPPTDAQVSAIVTFELALFAGQYWDYAAGALDAGGATGGPVNLAVQPYYPGVNDSLGQDPQGHAFTPASMQLFAAWANLSPNSPDARRAARADIAAGEQLFDSAPMVISNVRGLNDNVVLSSPTSFAGTCATCHDTPNIGHHSLPLPLDIGIGHLSDPAFEPDPVVAAAVAELSEPDLPVFLISGCPNPFNPGQVASFYTTDPGKALVTGHCSDFNRVKGPILRGLAGRAPYFHNGSGGSLREVVNFYNQRFQMNLTDQQKRQLVTFLNTL